MRELQAEDEAIRAAIEMMGVTIIPPLPTLDEIEDVDAEADEINEFIRRARNIVTVKKE
jgi:hypothetical protein